MHINDLKKTYKYNEDLGTFFIDIQLEDYRDVYSEWDFSPFINRDLDDDLIEFLVDCSYEIPLKYQLTIDFHILDQAQDKSREVKTQMGISNFFRYQCRKTINARKRKIKEIVSLFILGSLLLFSGFILKENMTTNIFSTLISEGVFIGGWVMLWEMFTAWSFDIRKINTKLKHFKRLVGVDMIFTYNDKKTN